MKRLIWITVLVIVAVALWYIRVYVPGRSDRWSGADDMVVLDEPRPGDRISSPLTVRGRARGTWFFEASFPVVLTDWDGRIIAQVPAQATDEWMTTDFVPFEATLNFTVPAGPGDGTNRGFLILRKDNPSGLPEHDDSREIMIHFE